MSAHPTRDMLRHLIGPHAQLAAPHDATDKEGDGGLADAVELLRNAVLADSDEDFADEEKDPFSDLGDLAVAARRLMCAHLKTLVESPAPIVDDKPARDAAAFILRCHKEARGRAA